MSRKIAMLLDHNGAYDSRVVREARALIAAGYNLRVFCKSVSPAPVDSRDVDIIYVDCYFDSNKSLRNFFQFKDRRLIMKPQTSATSNLSQTPALPTKNIFKRIIGTMISFYTNFLTVRDSVLDFAPDIIHAHDLSMLPAGVKLAKILNIPLIYDSHEYEYDRNVIENRFQKAIRRKVECHNITKADAVITVSDSIADALQVRHGILRPHIVLNSSEKNRTTSSPLTREKLSFPSGPIGVYFGGVQSGRGLEQAIEAISYVPDCLCIIGRITESQRKGLMSHATKLGVDQKVFLLPPLSTGEILSIGGIFDYAIIPIQNTCESYNFALPNKLFQSTSAGLPLIVTPLTEIRRFTKYYDLGYVANGFTGRELADAILSLGTSPLNSAKHKGLESYSWQSSEKILLSIYKSLLKGKKLPPSQSLPHSHGV